MDIVSLSKLLQQNQTTVAGDEWLTNDLEKELDAVNPTGRNNGNVVQQQTSPVKIIFSDIDGSLIHYPKETTNQQQQEQEQGNDLLYLPPSATGMRGIISSHTLQLCSDLRAKGVMLVLVTGARTSTLLNRLPYLPKADAYCTESGGRIFYPTNVDCCTYTENNEGSNSNQFTPVKYNGAKTNDLQPFGLREDMVWRDHMGEEGAGIEGYVGNNVYSNRCEDDMSEDGECLIDYESTQGFPIVEDEVPISQRTGHLWDFGNHLVNEYDFVLDTKSYSTCFRVNMKHQTNDKFVALLNSDIAHPQGIGKSTNLGCIDFYPTVSGKQHCCQYLANESGHNLATESVCICDDDNDIEMALACSYSYIPTLTSKTMVDTLKRKQSNFTLTFGPDVRSTAATEAALELILQRSKTSK